jgi:hypothetical protein
MNILVECVCVCVCGFLSQDDNVTRRGRGVVSVCTGRPFHVIVGPADKIGAIFANKDARAAGLTEKVRKAGADTNEVGAVSGRDLAKPIVSSVTVQVVQDNMASPRAPVIPEDDDYAPPDQKPVSTPTAKMYSYNSDTTLKAPMSSLVVEHVPVWPNSAEAEHLI